LVERFCFELDENFSRGQIIAEARDPILDRKLDLAWLNLKISGTRFVQAGDINNKIDNLSLRRKEDNLAGLEIADAIVTPIARKILNRNSRISLDVIQQKMRKNNLGEVTGYGLVILPKK